MSLRDYLDCLLIWEDPILVGGTIPQEDGPWLSEKKNLAKPKPASEPESRLASSVLP